MLPDTAIEQEIEVFHDAANWDTPQPQPTPDPLLLTHGNLALGDTFNERRKRHLITHTFFNQFHQLLGRRAPSQPFEQDAGAIEAVRAETCPQEQPKDATMS